MVVNDGSLMIDQLVADILGCLIRLLAASDSELFRVSPIPRE